jgi:nucleoside-diphosphate-sugar epimerase
MKVFITGASGFLGRALAERYRAGGARVAGMDLHAEPARDVVAGDVSVPGDWQRHAEGADIVVHTAAVVSLRLERADDTWRVNVLGTRHALDAAVAGGARRFVHFSSVTAFGFRFPDGVDESHPVRPTGVPYPDTKIASEQHVLQAHAEGRVAVTVVRPGDVYGPGSRAWAVLPVELIRARRFTLPDRGRGIFSPVYVDDLVEGVVRAGEREAAVGRVITLSGGVGVPNRDFFGRYAGALGMRLTTLPTPVARAGAGLVWALNRHRSGDNDVNPRSLDYMLRRGTYSIATARDLLEWAPRVEVGDGLERTVAWLRAEGCLG